MLAEFKRFIEQHSLLAQGQKTLVAVSGGIDSVAMARLFHQSGFVFAITHCNFGLRANESDSDAEFVQELARIMNVPFFVQDFDTKAFAKKNGLSTQMAARELRYSWFEEVRQQKGFDQVAVATHRDDEIETVLINLVRGTGLSGLHGILPKRGHIIRPLMFATRADIEAYASTQNIAFREDSSNQENDYIRNRIRNQVIPVLKEINPALNYTFSQNISNFNEVESIYRAVVEQARKQVMTEIEGAVSMNISELKQYHPVQTWLLELLKPFGFRRPVVDDICQSLNGSSGKQFLSKTHRLIKDREHLFITPCNEANPAPNKIKQSDHEIDHPLNLSMQIINTSQAEIPASSKIACLDLEKLKFPLTVRKWQNGDAFYPLGMKNKKKLSDFFIDGKIPVNEKENTFVLMTGKKIAWVIGHRIDDRFKIIDSTSKVYRIEITQ